MDSRASINGILIHQLPEDCQKDVLELFPRQSYSHVKHSFLGLRIYFYHYNFVHENILRKVILVRKILYNIYPLVTNLTVHDIRCYASMSAIKKLVRPFGFVLDMYTAEEVIQIDTHTTVYLTNDYRVVLDVPEVIADLILEPLIVPGVDFQFSVTYFCRLCRQNGHKQHQCLKEVSKNPPKSVQSFSSQFSDTPDQIHLSEFEYQNDVDDKHPIHCTNHQSLKSSNTINFVQLNQHKKDPINSNRRFTKYFQFSSESNQTDTSDLEHENKFDNDYFPADNTKFEIRRTSKTASAMNLKQHKEHSINGNQTFTVCMPLHKKSSYKSNKGSSSHSKVIPFQYDDLIIGNKIKSSQQTHKSNDLKAAILEGVNWKGSTYIFDKGPSQRQVLVKKSEGPKMNVTARKLPKKREGLELSRVVPPGIEVADARKLLQDMASYSARDLPPEVQRKLRIILEWNSTCAYANLREPELKLLRLIELRLHKAKSGRSPATSDSAMDLGKKKGARSHTEGSQASETTKTRNPRISQGIIDALAEVDGELTSRHLFNFLVQARGRRKILEIAEYFTTNIDGLIDQLNDIIGVYIRSGKKGVEEEHDALWIKRLCKRLDQSKNTSNNPRKKERGIISRQSSDQKPPMGSEGKVAKGRTRRTSVSKVILGIASKTNGILNPCLLCNFLEQARRRRNIVQMAKHFTADNSGLVDQLQDVVRLYFLSGKKGANEDQDIRWIKSLCERLEQGQETKRLRSERSKSQPCAFLKMEQLSLKAEPVDLD